MINPKNIIQSSSPTSNISVNTTPVASSPRSPSQTIAPPPDVAATTGATVSSHRPLAITILLWLTFADLVYKVGTSIMSIIALIATFRVNHLLAHIFETSPLLCFSPIFFALLAVIILFLIFKTTSYTRTDYFLLFISSVAIPVIYSLFSYFVLVSSNLNPIIAFLQEANLLFLVIIISLAISSKKFSAYATPLSDQSTIVFALFGSILVFPSFFFTYSLINTSLNPDTQLSAIQTLAGHKLYSPTILPLHLRPDTTFYIDDKKYPNLPNSTVKIAYSTPITSTTQTNRPIVVINQTKVTPEFDLDNYMSGQLTTTTSKAEYIPLPLAINQKGLVKSTDPQSPSSLKMTSLAFITPDYILINLISPSSTITSTDLITIAQSLH